MSILMAHQSQNFQVETVEGLYHPAIFTPQQQLFQIPRPQLSPGQGSFIRRLLSDIRSAGTLFCDESLRVIFQFIKLMGNCNGSRDPRICPGQTITERELEPALLKTATVIGVAAPKGLDQPFRDIAPVFSTAQPRQDHPLRFED